MSKLSHLLMLSVVSASIAARAASVDEAPIGEAVERHLPSDDLFMQWVQDPQRVESEQGDTLETRETITDELETIKLGNLVAPIRFESGVANIPDTTVKSLSEILDRMRDRINVRLHLIGHADNRPLSPRLAAIYGDNAGLSRERAGEVAEYFQTALALPPEAISYAWEGDTQPVATNLTEEGKALNRRVEVEVWYDQLKERVALEEVLVPHEIERLKVCRMETVCKLRYVEGHARRAKVQNLISPLHYEEETIDVGPQFIEQVRQALENLGDKQNVVVRFIGYTDDQALNERNERIYATHVGLSKARARRVALALQDNLNIPTTAIESDGRGTSRPMASNETALGRSLNRRVEVEFWYDDPLQELPDEPQLCPESAGAELVTRVYDPPWGSIDNIEFSNGQPVVPSGFEAELARAMADVKDRTNPRVRFVGYTRNEGLARRTALVYGDDIGLSSSRARRAMEVVDELMEIDDSQLEFEGRGYVHSRDVVNDGFIQGDDSHVSVEVLYDELAILDDYEGVDITRITRELTPQNPLGLNLMRITVDGEPIDDPQRSSADIQRCTDVALEKVDIRFGYDNLRSAPRLSITANPSRIMVAREIDRETHVSKVRFRMYTNYSYYIERAEVRVFDAGQSQESEPLDIIEID
ncbi:MAG TPA: OmpA family protein, partial [Pseudomonadales bacterium]